MRVFIFFITVFLSAPLFAEVGVRERSFLDEPFEEDVTIAVGVLESLGSITGYPDGTFRPEHTLNRAEFLKVAVLSHPVSNEAQFLPSRCFPDVKEGDWFSPYVCFAKALGVVKGYDDGLFRPGDPVSYAEALKIVGELFRFRLNPVPEDSWMDPYVRIAKSKGIYIDTISLTDSLSRGQMARLIARVHAVHHNELDAYLLKEQGEDESQEEPATLTGALDLISDEEALVDVIEDDVDSVAIVEQENDETLSQEINSQFLLIDEQRYDIASASFLSASDARLRIIEIQFEREIISPKEVILLDQEKREIGILKKKMKDPLERTWRGEFEKDTATNFPENEERTLFIAVRFYPRNKGAIAQELLRVRAMRLTIQESDGVISTELFPIESHFPFHQTSQAVLTRVIHVGAKTAVLKDGEDQLLASFAFEGDSLVENAPRIVSLRYSMKRSEGVSASAFSLQGENGKKNSPCYVEDPFAQPLIVQCVNIPQEIAIIPAGGPRIINLYGTISVADNARSPFLQTSLASPGAIGESGAVRWSDASGEYTWVMGETPLAEGTLFETE